jgi:hypothetical protein
VGTVLSLQFTTEPVRVVNSVSHDYRGDLLVGANALFDDTYILLIVAGNTIPLSPEAVVVYYTDSSLPRGTCIMYAIQGQDVLVRALEGAEVVETQGLIAGGVHSAAAFTTVDYTADYRLSSPIVVGPAATLTPASAGLSLNTSDAVIKYRPWQPDGVRYTK